MKNIFGPVTLNGPLLDARNQRMPSLSTTADASRSPGAAPSYSSMHDSTHAPAPGAMLISEKLPGDPAWPVPDKSDFLDKIVMPSTYPAPGSVGDISQQEASILIKNGAVLVPDKDGPDGPLEEWLVTSCARHADENVDLGDEDRKGQYVVKVMKENQAEGDSPKMEETVKVEEVAEAGSVADEPSTSRVAHSLSASDAGTSAAPTLSFALS